MRKALLSFLLMATIGVMAQNNDYTQMLVDGRSWAYHEGRMGQVDENGYSYDFITHDISVKGDTLFNGKACKKLYDRDGKSETLIGFAYEEGRRVYMQLLTAGHISQYIEEELFGDWVLVYDFTRSVGDETDMWGLGVYRRGQFVLRGVDTIAVAQRDFRRYTWGNPRWENIITHVVEGVGSETGLLPVLSIIANGSFTTFLGCYEDGECIFAPGDFNKLSGHTADLPGITANSPAAGTSFDLQGRRISATPRRGLYIRDGRKTMKK